MPQPFNFNRGAVKSAKILFRRILHAVYGLGKLPKTDCFRFVHSAHYPSLKLTV